MTKSNGQNTSDGELFERIVRRDEPALGALYDRYAKQIYNLILRIVRHKQDAENILQDVFLQVWHRANTYDPKLGPPAIWLIRVARNKAIDHWRSKGNQVRRLENDITQEFDLSDNSSDPHRLMADVQSSSIVRGALGRLPAEQRQLIFSAYYEGYSQSDLAEKLSIPLGTVKSRIRAGMIALREQLKSLNELSHSTEW
jgi:RNA polymerase sigma-70 factor (ECF subfamily)